MPDPALFRIIQIRRAIGVLTACYALAIMPPAADQTTARAQPAQQQLTASHPAPIAPPQPYWIERAPWTVARALAWHLRYRPVLLLPPATPPTSHRTPHAR